MKKIVKFILLNKEANLFDSLLFILKAFVSVLTAYAIAQQIPLLQKDLISILFGLMMTLEPVTITGVRSGFKQITATILGALLTALIVALFGVNLWTVALSVSATLYLCLKINWREVSPVAIFTSIYMTNYVQYNLLGEPSMLLTFRLRIICLGTGVLVSAVFNLIFSLFFYKKMERKRITHILMQLSEQLKLLKEGMTEDSPVSLEQGKEMLSDTFHKIDWLSALLRDKEKGLKTFGRRVSPSGLGQIQKYQELLSALRKINHLIYDTIYIMTDRQRTEDKINQRVVSAGMDKLIRECEELTHSFADHKKTASTLASEEAAFSGGDNRIMKNLSQIEELLHHLRFMGI